MIVCKNKKFQLRVLYSTTLTRIEKRIKVIYLVLDCFLYNTNVLMYQMQFNMSGVCLYTTLVSRYWTVCKFTDRNSVEVM